MTLKSKLRYMLLTFIAAMVLGVGGAHAGAFDSDDDAMDDQETADEWADFEEETDDEWGEPDDDEDDGL